MSERKIYVVQGSTGEYSDRTDWLVRAYLERAAAEAKVVKCSERARLFRIEQDKDSWWNENYHAQDSIREAYRDEDPDMRCDYTGTTYSICEVSLESP